MSDQHSNDQPEKLVSSTEIYNGRVIRVTVDEVELADGRRTKRDVVNHNGAVAIVPIDQDGRVIMVRQYRHPTRRTLLELPAGGLEAGESADDAAQRELQEEIGFKAGKIEPLGAIFLAPGYSTEMIHIYVAWELSESILDMDEDENITTERVSFSEFLDHIAHGTICDAKTIAGMFWAKEKFADKLKA